MAANLFASIWDVPIATTSVALGRTPCLATIFCIGSSVLLIHYFVRSESELMDLATRLQLVPEQPDFL